MRAPRSVVIALLMAFVLVSMIPVGIEKVQADNPTLLAGGRMVFVEDVTATWCGYCPAASEGLKDLSDERSDFRFITLVDDRVNDAADRNDEFDVSGFPTVMFDGGFEEVVGSQSSTDPYSDAIDSCLDRDAPSLDVDVDCFDEGGSELRIDVEITNNDGEAYSGRLLVNIVEIVSRYLDADGNNYPNSLLGYAVDESISIASGGTFTTSASWTGSDYDDMEGNDFSDIDPDNIVVYAAVINGASHYKVRPGLPPSFFTAYYVDAVGEAYPEELTGAPEISIIAPRNGRTVSETVDMIVEVTAENNMGSVEVKIGSDDWEDMALENDQYVYSWDTTEESNGNIKITFKATDSYDLIAMTSIDVIVENEDATLPPEIISMFHSPAIVKEGDKVEVEAEIESLDTDLTKVELSYCVGSICEIPIPMVNEGDGIYTLEIGPFQGGDEVEYHILVKDNEGNSLESDPVSFTVQEVAVDPDNSGGDTTTTTGGDGTPDDSPSPYLLLLPAAMIIAVLIFRRKK